MIEKLTEWERETVITYNEATSQAEVYTCSKPLIRKLDKLCVEREEISCVKSTVFGGVDIKTYTVPKRWVSVRPPKRVVLTEEQRNSIAERLRKAKNNAVEH